MKRILTGIKPTGSFHIGSYAGFLQSLLFFQKKNYEIFLMIADSHALTDPSNIKEIKKIKKEMVAEIIALGVDPEKVNIFLQSENPYHFYLAWVLSCFTSLGDLYRMHHFKELTQKLKIKKEIINSGALYYPVLQAADILIYQADIVPVGEDQKQHIELAREIARNFNKKVKKIFKIPKEYILETGRIMSLSNPYKKMSKSEPEGILGIFEPKEKIIEKIKKAVTDSDNQIIYNKATKPGISNLILIYKILTEKSIQEIEKEFKGVSYKDFKEKIIEEFFKKFESAREKKKEILSKVDIYLEKGKEIALSVASETIKKINELV